MNPHVNNETTDSISVIKRRDFSYNTPIPVVSDKKVNIQMVSEEAVGTNSDEYSFSQTTPKSEKNINNRLDNLIATVQKTLEKYNCKLTNEDIEKILEFATRKKINELKNITNVEQINKYTQLLTQTIEQMVKEGKELKSENIAKEARDYQMVINAGYADVNEFQKYQNNNKESLIQRLESFSGKKWESLKDYEKVQLINEYFYEYYTKQENNLLRRGNHILKNALGKNDSSFDESIKVWKETDIAKLIYNTPDEDKKFFIQVMKEIKGCDAAQLFVDMLESYKNQELKTETANSVTTNDAREIVKNSNYVTSEEKNNAMSYVQENVTKNQSDEAIIRDKKENKAAFEEFLNNNREIIKIIEQKIKNGEKLTKEENSILEELNIYNYQFNGLVKGYIFNHVASEDVLKTAFTNTINTLQQSPNSTEVIANVSQYAQEHQEELRFSANETNEIFTNSGLEAPIQVQNTTEQAQNTQNQAVSTQTQSQNETQIGFAQNEQTKQAISNHNNNSTGQAVQVENTNYSSNSYTNNTNIENSNCTVQACNTSENTNKNSSVITNVCTTIIDAVKQGSEAVKKYFTQNKIKATYEVLNNADKINDEAVLEKAYETYKTRLTGKEQTNILTGNVDTCVLTELIPITDEDALVKYGSDKKASSYYANLLISNAVEKIKEEKS